MFESPEHCIAQFFDVCPSFAGVLVACIEKVTVQNRLDLARNITTFTWPENYTWASND